MALCVKRCIFKIEQYGETFEGIVICSDSDTPVTFVYSSDGKPVTEEIWNYSIRHWEPWIRFSNKKEE